MLQHILSVLTYILFTPLAMPGDADGESGDAQGSERVRFLCWAYACLAGGFISVELVAAAAAASIFVMDCPRCTGRVPAWTDEPPALLPPPALEAA